MAQNAVLAAIDEQIKELETRIAKVQPMVDELHRLKHARRVLVSESGRAATAITPQVQEYLKKNGPARPRDIAEAIGVDNQKVRSHLTHNKGTLYGYENGLWMALV